MIAAQMTLALDAPPIRQARDAGHEGARRAEQAASRIEPGFRERAEALILQKLAHGPASGEDCTDYVRAAGLQMADGRALGAVYARLLRRGLIVRVGECARARGNGTRGGSVYALAGLAR